MEANKTIFFEGQSPTLTFFKISLIEGVHNDTNIPIISPVLCLASEKRNIVGGAMNFGFYTIVQGFPYWGGGPPH